MLYFLILSIFLSSNFVSLLASKKKQQKKTVAVNKQKKSLLKQKPKKPLVTNQQPLTSTSNTPTALSPSPTETNNITAALANNRAALSPSPTVANDITDARRTLDTIFTHIVSYAATTSVATKNNFKREINKCFNSMRSYTFNVQDLFSDFVTKARTQCNISVTGSPFTTKYQLIKRTYDLLAVIDGFTKDNMTKL